MRCKDDLGAFRDEVLDGREGSCDTSIISNLLRCLVLWSK
jgi:hypothetical protein